MTIQDQREIPDFFALPVDQQELFKEALQRGGYSLESLGLLPTAEVSGTEEHGITHEQPAVALSLAAIRSALEAVDTQAMDSIGVMVVQLHAMAEKERDPQKMFRLRAAICLLLGDDRGVEQNLVASKISAADWDAAKRGEIDY